jgi:hypothetical protein
VKHLISLIKKVEIEIRSSNTLSKSVLEELSNLKSWDYKILQDAILRIRMFVANNDLNFVYKMYEDMIDSYKFYKNQNYKQVDLIIACLRRDQLDTSLTDVANRLYTPNNIKKDIFEIWGLQVTQARNLAVKEALKRGAKYLLFIDDDIIASNNSLVKLFELEKKYPDNLVYAANYLKKIPGKISAHDIDYNNQYEDNVYELNLCAMGFTLINIEKICEKTPMPLFWEFGSPDGFWLMGEDAFFTNNIKEYCQISPLIDLSISLLHYDKTWHKIYGKRNKDLTYATNQINNLDQFERLRVPKKYPKISIAIPTRDVNSPIACNLNKLVCLRGYQTEFITVNNLTVDEARVNLVKQAINNNSDYILFIDDDIVPPIDGFVKLLEHIEKDEIDIISGDYPLKGDIKHSIHLQLDSNGMVQELERCDNIKDSNLVKNNWLIGLGFVLIDINFFKQAREPWFLCHSKNPNRKFDDGGVNEDAHFSELCHINGYSIYIDKSIKCLHLDFQNQIVYSLDDEYDINKFAGFDRA